MFIIRSLKSDELDDMYDLLAKSFAKSPADLQTSKKWHKKAIESDPFFNCELNRVVEVDGKLAARIGIYDRTMLFNGEELRIGAIGGVCTDPKYQGCGFAKKLLQECTTYMRDHSFDASLLFGNPVIYEKSGWETLSTFGMSTNFKLNFNANSDRREVNIKNDIKWLSCLYDKDISNMTGPFKRSPEYWEKWINNKVNDRETHTIHIIEKNGRRVGYFVSKRNNTICEIGWDRDVFGAIEETIASIFSYVKEEIISFSFFSQEIFDFICSNSVTPTLDVIENEKKFISKDAIYSGLFKLINDNKIREKSTKNFNKKLRMNNYTFWDIDRF